MYSLNTDREMSALKNKIEFEYVQHQRIIQIIDYLYLNLSKKIIDGINIKVWHGNIFISAKLDNVSIEAQLFEKKGMEIYCYNKDKFVKDSKLDSKTIKEIEKIR